MYYTIIFQSRSTPESAILIVLSVCYYKKTILSCYAVIVFV